MSDILPLGLSPPSDAAGKKSRGRPPGSKNKNAGDLAKWFKHVSGSTPGQQLIDLIAITPKDIRLAKAWAKQEETLLVSGSRADLRAFAPRALAMVWKAHNFALLNRIPLPDAWAMMFKGHDMLMKYVHPSQGAAEPEKVDKRPAIYADSARLGDYGNPSQDVDFVGDLFFAPPDLAQAASHTGPNVLTDQSDKVSGSAD